MFIVSVEFIVPLVILVFCYIRILWIIRARIGSQMGNDEHTAKFEQARNNLIKTLFVVVFFFFICYLGSEVVDLFFYLGFDVDWNSGYYKFVVSMRILNCTVNPFIYLVNYKDFQRALMEQFGCRKSRSNFNSNLSSSISGSVENTSQHMRKI